MSSPATNPASLPLNAKERIARRIARELRDGFYVNLGIGLPTLIASHVPPGIDVFFQSENGMLGVGPPPAPGTADPDLINAGKQPVTELPGCSYFSSADSFATRDGEPRILKSCTLPLTGRGVVHDIVTELCWIKVVPEGLLLTELAEGLTVADVQYRTEVTLIVAPHLGTLTTEN